MKPSNTSERRKERISEALSRLDPAQRSIYEKELKYIPESCRLGELTALLGECSPRAAIKAQCLQCVGYERVGVKECTALRCPLYAFRPFQ